MRSNRKFQKGDKVEICTYARHKNHQGYVIRADVIPLENTEYNFTRVTYKVHCQCGSNLILVAPDLKMVVRNIRDLKSEVENELNDREVPVMVKYLREDYFLSSIGQSLRLIPLSQVLSHVSEKDREILVALHGLDNGETLSVKDVGHIHGMTRQAIKQRQVRAIDKIRKNYGVNDDNNSFE